MADVVTRLKVESNEYDSKIKRAQQGLLHFEEACRKVGGTLAVLEKDEKDFVQSLGSMETVSKTARGRLNELTTAFTELSMQYKRLTDEEKRGDFGKALSGSLEQLKTRVQAAKQELKDINAELNEGGNAGGGGFLSGLSGKLDGAIQVFAGNMMTKAVSAVANLGSEMYGLVQHGIELARQGEGIRTAFERLGRGDILDGLREATHGTVTDLELMKAAVKFNDFRLPVEELGTMLAFAQQKAKDTGQSVDYMVDSIVTGLGRKSLMILDNLGLSAAEIKNRMAETGDMTKAVGAIIREQMAKAGDYVETAADRAAQATVSLENKMEDLGRKFLPLQEASTNLWTSMKIGILDIIGGPLAELLNKLTEAGRIKNLLGSYKEGDANLLNRLSTSDNKMGEFIRTYNDLLRRAKAEEDMARKIAADRVKLDEISAASSDSETASAVTSGYGALYNAQMDHERRARELRAAAKEYAAGAKEILSVKNTPTTPQVTPIVPRAAAATEKELSPMQSAQKRIAELTAEAQTADEERLETIREEVLALQKQVELYKERQQYVTTAPDLSKVTVGVKPGYIADAERAQSQPTSLEAMQRTAEQAVRAGNLKADTATMQTLLQDAARNAIDLSGLGLSSPANLITAGVDVDEAQWEGILEKYNELREQIGLEPIKINLDTGAVDGKALAETGKGVQASWKAAASAVTSVGQALQQVEDPSAKIAGIVGQAVANIALGFATATSKEARLGVWGWIAAVAGGIGTMLGTIAAIKNATAGSFAEGGIVPGNDYNDGLIANVSSGEVILNRAQQDSLAAQLESGPAGRIAVSDMEVRGESLFVVFSNYLDASGKTLNKWVR